MAANPTVRQMEAFVQQKLVPVEPEIGQFLPLLRREQYSAEFMTRLESLATRIANNGHPERQGIIHGIRVIQKHLETRNGVKNLLSDSGPIPVEMRTLGDASQEKREQIKHLTHRLMERVRRMRNEGQDPLNHLESIINALRNEREDLLYMLFMSVSGGTDQYPQVLPNDLSVIAWALKLLMQGYFQQPEAHQPRWIRQVYKTCYDRCQQLNKNCQNAIKSDMTGGTVAVPQPLAPRGAHPPASFRLDSLDPQDHTPTPVSMTALPLTGAPAFGSHVLPGTPTAAVPYPHANGQDFNPVASALHQAPPAQGPAASWSAVPNPNVSFPPSDQLPSGPAGSVFGSSGHATGGLPSQIDMDGISFDDFDPLPAVQGPPTEPVDAYGPTGTEADLPGTASQVDFSQHQVPASEPEAPKSEKDILEDFEKQFQIRIDKEIGRGGMGAVYLAEQKGLNRKVCVKRILASHDLEALERFEIEVKTAAQLAGVVPGIPEHFGVHTLHGNTFLVFELFVGQDDYHIEAESIAAALLNTPDEEKFGHLHNAAKAFKKFMVGEIEHVEKESLYSLVSLFQRFAKKKRDQKLMASAKTVLEALRPVEVQGLFTRDEIDATEGLYQALCELEGVMTQYPLFTEMREFSANPKSLAHREGPTLAHYFKLKRMSGLDKPLNGTDIRLLFSVIRDLCGDELPEAELFELYGIFMLSQARTMSGVSLHGVLHRDLKPDNSMYDAFGTGILMKLTNAILHHGGTLTDAKERRESFRQVVLDALDEYRSTRKKELSRGNKLKEPVYTIDFGLARPQDEANQKFLRRMSSPSTEQVQGEENSRLTQYGMLLGTPHYMAPKTVSPDENQEDDLYADYHAFALTVLEVFAGKQVGVTGKGGINNLLLGTMGYSAIADRVREEFELLPDAVGTVDVPKSWLTSEASLAAFATQYETFAPSNTRPDHVQVPLSRIDIDQDLVTFLEKEHPFLLDFFRRSTYLGSTTAHFPSIHWEELTNYLENWLEPKVRKVTPMWIKVAAGLGLTGAFLGLSAYGYSEYEKAEIQRETERLQKEKAEKRATEIAGIEARLEEAANAGEKMLEIRFNSDYFSSRINDIARLRDLKNDELTQERRDILHQQEKFYTLMMYKMKYLEKIRSYHELSEDSQSTDSAFRMVESSRAPLIDLYNYIKESQLEYRGPVLNANQIEASKICRSTNDDRIIRYFVENSRRRHEEVLILFAEMNLKTLEFNSGEHTQFDTDSNSIFAMHEYRLARFFVARTFGNLLKRRNVFESFSVEEKGLIMKSLFASLDYLKEMYDFSHIDENHVSDENKAKTTVDLGACMNAICELSLLTDDPFSTLSINKNQ